MDYMGYRQGYHPKYDDQSYTVQGQTHGIHGYPYGVTYEQQQVVLAHLQHQQRAAVMMGHGGMPPGKLPESKPRLAREEVDLLEKEFQKNPKPNSSLKREFADQMRVDVARINNWFQNRRAKAKQIKKTQEYEAQQAAERTGSDGQCVDEDGDSVGGELYELSSHSEPVHADTAPFTVDESLDHEPTSTEAEEDDDVDDCASLEVAEQPVFDLKSSKQPLPGSASLQATVYGGASDNSFSTATSASLPPAFHQSLPYHHSVNIVHPIPNHSIPLNAMEQFCLPAASPPLYAQYDAGNDRAYVTSLDLSGSSFPSRSLPAASRQSMAGSPEATAPVLGMQSPAQSSPASVVAIAAARSSPPRLDLLSRRNIRRPAQITPTALRSCSFGPKTGLEAPTRLDMALPMRRIASATGSMSGRIQKSSSAPRSPMFMDRNRGALLHSLHTRLSPPVPTDTGATMMDQRAPSTDGTASTTSEEDQRYLLGAGSNSYFHGVDPLTIKTPPGTPGMQVSFLPPSVDIPWGYLPTEEPLVTPGLGSFGSDMDFPHPHVATGYAISQPPTPSFPHGHMSMPSYYPSYQSNGIATIDCKFTDPFAHAMSAKSSPTAAASKSFQFAQNVTPQDFNHAPSM